LKATPGLETRNASEATGRAQQGAPQHRARRFLFLRFLATLDIKGDDVLGMTEQTKGNADATGHRSLIGHCAAMKDLSPAAPIGHQGDRSAPATGPSTSIGERLNPTMRFRRLAPTG